MYYTDEFVESLPSVPLEEKRMLPKSPGIYLAVAENKTVLYIGQSINVCIRWQQHHRFHELSKFGNVRIAWVNVSDPSLLLGIEKALIRHFKPPLNGIPIPLVIRTTPKKIRKLKVRVEQNRKLHEKKKQSANIKFRVEPEIYKAFDELCDRANITKSELLREYISFLLDHPELEIGRETLEEMLTAYKATSPPKNENVH